MESAAPEPPTPPPPEDPTGRRAGDTRRDATLPDGPLSCDV
eukprot:CAMPEP_0176427074 /NCGR_PEP_ID=MMETSP0127-20121128/12322_1 /TAXON_ID=938130 /ORGANISM="Platyophrya macrostoma, Strain WH" /LENGTH=40 /DNA_ID= /DNA_START= /DNA_END= /DNA_ORIENTATION=